MQAGGQVHAAEEAGHLLAQPPPAAAAAEAPALGAGAEPTTAAGPPAPGPGEDRLMQLPPRSATTM